MTLLLALWLVLSHPSNRVEECVTGIPPRVVPCAPGATTTTTTTYYWSPPVPPISALPPPVEGEPYRPPRAITTVTANQEARRQHG